MYEQNDVPVFRRILWLGLWLVLAIAVLWIAIWLIFFRHTATKKVATPHKNTTQQHKSPGTVATPDSSSSSTNSSNTSGGNTPAQAGSPGQSTGTTNPSELANTGPGSLAVPVVAAAVGGSTLYYIRLRKKLEA